MPNKTKTKTDSNNTTFRYIREHAETILDGHFGLLAEKIVGHGYAGSVFRCAVNYRKPRSNKGKEYTAVKVMLKEKIKGKAAENEVKLLCMARGPNVLTFLDAAESVDAYLIVTEFCGRGDLHGMLSSLDNANVMAREYLLGVAAGLQSIHNNFIAHCDIKMKNILISDNNVPKIADFGFAMAFSSAEVTTSVCHGTKDYWAPEMCRQWPDFDPYKADIYALGVTFVGVCEKKPIKKSQDNIHRIVRDFKDGHQRELFQGMLHSQPSERSTLAQVMSNRWLLACMTPPPSP